MVMINYKIEQLKIILEHLDESSSKIARRWPYARDTMREILNSLERDLTETD